jgi:hypothetical protein
MEAAIAKVDLCWRAVWLGCLAGAGCTAADDDAPADRVAGDETPVDSAAETGGSDGPPPCTPALEIGTGDVSFQALNPGDPVTIVYGPQGGWHVWTAGRVTGLGPTLRVLPGLTDLATGTPIAGLADTDDTTILLADFDGCSGSFAGQRAIIDDWVPPEGPLIDYICGLAGTPLRLDLAVAPLLDSTATATGVPFAPVLTASVEVVAADDPYFVANFCQ